MKKMVFLGLTLVGVAFGACPIEDWNNIDPDTLTPKMKIECSREYCLYANSGLKQIYAQAFCDCVSKTVAEMRGKVGLKTRFTNCSELASKAYTEHRQRERNGNNY